MKKLAGFLGNLTRHLPRRVFTGLIRGYQLLISPVLPGSCRFYPSCSSYAIDAFSHHGVFKGAWLSISRIARCHPWGGEGFDPVAGSSLDPHHNHNHGQAGQASCHHASKAIYQPSNDPI